MTAIQFRYTLVADGPSDRALLPIIDWVLRRCGPQPPQLSERQFLDPRILDAPPRPLRDRIRRALELFPCDVLFVHRDAETAKRQDRVDEIERSLLSGGPPHVCLVPVRMTEAWLLIDEPAIRSAAGNPNGTHPLDLPPIATIEAVPDPKQMLRDLLLQATALHGRRRENFKSEIGRRVYRVSELIENFQLLDNLPAFREFRQDTAKVVAAWLNGTARN